MDTQRYEFIRAQRGPVSVVTITRPNALNALNLQVVQELGALFSELHKDLSIRCIVVTGEGPKAFVAGADIAQMSSLDPGRGEDFAGAGQQAFHLIETHPAPVLAAVNGFALGGGCELALACDIIYAAETAKFGQPEVKLGIMPGYGGTVRLPQRIGVGAANEWIFTGDMYSAQRAYELGLVQAIFPAATLLDEVMKIAKTIAARGPVAVQLAKRVMVQQANSAKGMGPERWSFGQLFATQDAREGTRAFVEKREPNFQGR